jgi:hypothetical protein
LARLQLQSAVQRRQALGKVIDRVRNEEQHMQQRQTQKDLDEVASRTRVKS